METFVSDYTNKYSFIENKETNKKKYTSFYTNEYDLINDDENIINFNKKVNNPNFIKVENK